MHISVEIPLFPAHVRTQARALQSLDQWSSRYIVRCRPRCLHKLLMTATGKRRVSPEQQATCPPYIHWHPYSPCSSMPSPKGDAGRFISPANPSASMDSRPKNAGDTHIWKWSALYRSQSEPGKKGKASVIYKKFKNLRVMLQQWTWILFAHGIVQTLRK